jgi:hypothetical protein
MRDPDTLELDEDDEGVNRSMRAADQSESPSRGEGVSYRCG